MLFWTGTTGAAASRASRADWGKVILSPISLRFEGATWSWADHFRASEGEAMMEEYVEGRETLGEKVEHKEKP